MDILQSPTDNLYIFLTMGGLTLLIFSIGFFYRRIQQLNQDTRDVSEEMERLDTEVNISKISFDQVKRKVEIKMQYLETRYGVKFLELNEIEKDVDQKTSVSKILKSIDPSDHESFIKDYTKLIDLLYSESIEKEKTQGKIKISKLNSEEVKDRSKQLKLFFWILILTIISCLTIIGSGFYMWYFKHQVFQDELLKYQLLESIK